MSHTAHSSLYRQVYVVRAYDGGLTTLSWSGLEGDDTYRIVLLPGTARLPRVLKRGKPDAP